LRSRFTEVWVEELTNLGELAGLIDTWSSSQGETHASHKKRKGKKRRDARDEKISADKKPVKTGAKKEGEKFASDKRFTHYST
jgi:hypothetical protein